ncbi:hypothetical protein FOA52_003573 [Chlamydomonas sp. UWO 241]|nr:hypothetical protein FOA52_003573 [Chlamydomonas sp. UWO 241]
MITVAVPPALACCLAIAITISVFRLTQSSIHVLDNERVTAAGLLNNVCFDKTGTLTEIGLVLSSVIPSSGGHFLHALSQPDQTLPALVRLLFAACHGLTHLDNSSSSSGGAEGAEGHAGASAAPGARGADGPLVVGDPLEQILFEAAGFDMAFVECGRPGAGGAGGGGGGMQLQVRPKAAWPPPTGAAAGAGGALLSPSQDGGSSKFADRGSTDRGSIELSVVPLMGGDSSGASSPQAAAAPWSDAASAMGAFAEAEPQHPMEPLLGVRLPPGASVAVLRRFDFSSERMRSSCVVAMPGEGGVPRRLLLLVKGSPEKVHELCDAASVPRSFDTALQGYTDQGLRVLAMAYRELGSEGEAGSFGGDVIGGGGVAAAPLWLSSSQDELEAGATFLGLVLMENKLKPDSAPTIAHLQRGGMSTCMVTGDHVRTGVTVARQCGILPAGVAAVVMDAAKGPLQSVVLTFQWLEPAGAAAAAAGDEGAFGAGAATPRKPSHGSGGGIPGGGAPSPAVPPVLLSVSDAMRRVACGSCAMAATGRAFSKVAAAEQARARARRRCACVCVCVCVCVAARKAARGAGMVTCAGHGHGHDRSAVGSDDAEAGDSGGGSGGFEAEGEDASSGGVPHGLFGLMLGACRVYARMSPDDKRDLVELLGPGQGDEGDSDSDDDERGGGGRGGGAAGGRSGGGGGADRAKALAKAVAEPEYATAGRGDHVGFCGDGANDLGALKAALVGVSLCDAEASIAAPLTSTNPSVSCMVTVVAEGRCALVTSLIIFKYTMVYAFIQVLALALLYQMGLIVGNYQYLLQDMFHTTLLASLMGLTQPAKNLGPRRPPTQVLSAAVIVPVVGQLVVVTAFQIGALKALQAQSWYTPFDTSANPTLDVATSETRPENGVLFIISCWQLVISAFVFNVHLGGGASFRRAIWTNTWLLGAMLALCAFNLYVLWAPEDPFKAEVPAVVGMPLELRAILFGIVCGNLAAALGVDALANAANAQAEARGGWGPAWARAFGRGAAASVGAQRSGGLIRPLGSLEGSQLLAGLPLSSIAVQ